MDEQGSVIRRSVIVVMALMVAVWVALYVFSFNDRRGQARPADFSFQGHTATAGKKIFQAYNCMGCHTIVGNGAYLAPDLTDTYAAAGPAWLAAYLPSAGTWPTEALLGLQVDRMAQQDLIEEASLDAYYATYPGARERIRRRGGQGANMPNLAFRPGEVDALIAFLSYTSAMDTEGWPPEVTARPAVITRARDTLHLRAAVEAPRLQPAAIDASTPAASQAEVPVAASQGPAERGRELAARFGCTACHSTGANRLVGPGWQGLYGSERRMSDGSTVAADESYLVTSITEPDRHLPDGYPPGIMPSFTGQLNPQDIDALVAYLKGLGTGDR